MQIFSFNNNITEDVDINRKIFLKRTLIIWALFKANTFGISQGCDMERLYLMSFFIPLYSFLLF